MNIIRWFGISIALGTAAFAAGNEGWLNDLDAAKAKAAQEHKPLILEFTGSAWCPPCKALHAKVLSSPEFTAFSKGKVLVALDYPPLSERAPEKIKAKPELARLMTIKERYGVPGFPTMFYYDAAGKQVAKVVGYGGENPKAYLAKLSAMAK